MKHYFDPYTLACIRCERSVGTLFDCETPRAEKKRRPLKSKEKRPWNHPPRPPKDAWLICAYCPPEDNEWPATSFSHSSGSFRHKTRVCNDHWVERYERRDATCACGKIQRRMWKKRGSTSVYVCRECRVKSRTQD